MGGAIAGLVGAVITSDATSSAADKQASSAANAQAAQNAATAYNQATQKPFIDAGTSALDLQQQQINNFNSSIQPAQQAAAGAVPKAMTEANLIQTPGYQFNLSQGLAATQNSAAARGLGVSGAALKGAATYATGLADSTYQNQFNNQQTQFADYNTNLQNALAVNNQAFGQNTARVTLGQNTAVQAGTQANAGAANSGAISVGLGNAQAASTIAGANALSGGLNSAANSYNQNNALASYNSNPNSGNIYGNTQASNDQATLNTGNAGWD